VTVLERIDHFKNVWRIALPHIAEPSSEDVARWCIYPLENVEAAILRTVRRFSKEKLASSFTSIEAYKYVTSVARSITENAHPNNKVA